MAKIMKLRYSSITMGSLVNGPGKRNVLHLQGCSIKCKGCFNPHTWSNKGGQLSSVYELAWKLMKGEPEGITISGGEPTEQWSGVKALLQECHKIDPTINVLMFSGLTDEQLGRHGIIEEAFSPYHHSQALVSTIVSGPYDRDQPSDEYLLGSKNQKILTWNGVPIQSSGPRVEVQVSKDGTVKVTGFPSKGTLDEIKTNFTRTGD